MKKKLLKATTTAIIASSMAGCGFFSRSPESTVSTKTGPSKDVVSVDETAKENKATLKEGDANKKPGKREGTNNGATSTVSIVQKKNNTYPVNNNLLNDRSPSIDQADAVLMSIPQSETSTVTEDTNPKPAVSKPELTPYQKELNRLNAEIEKAATELVTAKAAYESAYKAFQDAKDLLSEVTDSLVTDGNAVETAKAYVGAKKAALSIAKEKLTAAEEDYNDVILQSKADYDLAEAVASKILAEMKQESLDTYNSSIEAAEEEYDAAVIIARDTYNGDIEAASIIKESKTADAEAKYASAVQIANVNYDASVADAKGIQEAAIAEAQRIYDQNLSDCETAYAAAIEEAENDPEYLATVQALNDATQAQIDAVNAKVDADAALQTAKDELALAQQEKADKDADVLITMDAKNAAEADLEHAKAMLEASREALEIAKGNDAVAKQNVIDAERSVAEAETQKARADQDLSNANEALKLAQGRIDAASAEVENAEKDLAAANEAVAKGILGFYEFRLSQGDTEAKAAIDILNYASSDAVAEEKRTEIGKEGDATSLENVCKVFDYIREGNELAENDPNIDTSGFDLTYRLMAIAEMNANMASYTHNHPGKDSDYNTEYSTAENLAWGFGEAGTSRSPYRGWYDDEKPYYEKVAANPTDMASYYAAGHYRNLLGNSQGNRYTGFGINTEVGTTASGANKSTTFAQEFSWAKPGDTTYTVDEYEEMFLSYYNSVMQTVNKAQVVLVEKNALLTDLQSRGGLTSEEKDAIDQAKEEVSKAEDVLTSANNILSAANLNADKRAQELLSAEADVVEKEEIVVKENADYEITLSDLILAEEEAEAAGIIVIAREGNVTDAENVSQNAKDNLKDANKTLKEAEDVMGEKKQWVLDETEDEKQKFNEAKEDDIVERTINEQQEVFDQCAQPRVRFIEGENPSR